MKAFYSYKTKTPIEEIFIVQEGDYLTGIYFENEIDESIYEKKETPLITKTILQLREYLDGKRKEFDLPLNPQGTEFMMEDWKALQTIPYGQTCSYKDIAEKIGRPKAFRAVGLANNRNPISIVIPCHRVIGADGKMVGYGGGVHIKEYLLDLEKQNN